jgi:hypothetical protein
MILYRSMGYCTAEGKPVQHVRGEQTTSTWRASNRGYTEATDTVTGFQQLRVTSSNGGKHWVTTTLTKLHNDTENNNTK